MKRVGSEKDSGAQRMSIKVIGNEASDFSLKVDFTEFGIVAAIFSEAVNVTR